MSATVIIEPRFCGPSNCGNGGYVCGVLAGLATGPARVTLRKPTPLGVPLDIAFHGEHGRIRMERDGALVAESERFELDLVPPPPPTWDEATHAMSRYAGFVQHMYPRCFVCGPERAQGDGLRIFAGKVAERPVYAATWQPHASLCNERGEVRLEMMWAALDCPGYFAIVGQDDRRSPKWLLGNLAARIEQPVTREEPCIVYGWDVWSQGRKYQAGTAIAGRDGEIRAVALATWIAVDYQVQAGHII